VQHGWIAAVHKSIAGFQRDEVYIGTAEERAKGAMADDTAHMPVGPGHMAKLPGFAENAPRSLKKLLAKDPSVGKYISDQVDRMENGES
jgi:Silicon transporter.